MGSFVVLVNEDRVEAEIWQVKAVVVQLSHLHGDFGHQVFQPEFPFVFRQSSDLNRDSLF
jgi:hypothetical protein